MDLAKHVIVRYRSHGHVRFQLPETLCHAPIAERLASDLRRIEGIYRVDLSPRQRKLSIRFLEHICNYRALSEALYRLVSAIEWTEPALPPQPALATLPTELRKRLSAVRPVRWVRAKMQEARETATAIGILARRQAIQTRARSLLTEDTLILFLNDALALYLIKLHWHLLTQHWIRRPWQYRYEWMAAGYTVFLYIRSRRPKE